MLHADNTSRQYRRGVIQVAEELEAQRTHHLRTAILVLVVLACILSVGSLFTRYIASFQRVHNVATPETVAETGAAVPVEDAADKLPPDIPMYKGGNIMSGKDVLGVQRFEIVFTLGSIREIKDFYSASMAKAGWREYAAGQNVSAFDKDSGRKATLTYSYYGGKVKLVLTAS
jgi:hypothetical protein